MSQSDFEIRTGLTKRIYGTRNQTDRFVLCTQTPILYIYHHAVTNRMFYSWKIANQTCSVYMCFFQAMIHANVVLKCLLKVHEHLNEGTRISYQHFLSGGCTYRVNLKTSTISLLIAQSTQRVNLLAALFLLAFYKEGSRRRDSTTCIMTRLLLFQLRS